MRRLAAALLPILFGAACHASRPAHPTGDKPLPRAAYTHYLAGKMAMYAQDWPTAAAELASAQALAPDEAMIVVALAHAQAKAKDLPAARASLAGARTRWPDHVEVWLATGDVLAADDVPEATRAYQRALTLAPDDERGYLGIVKIDPAHAEATLRTLVKRVPTSVEGHYRLAVMMGKRDQLADAIPELRAVLELDPDHIDARMDLARALRRTGHLAEAVVQTRSAFDRAAQPLDVAEELFWLLLEADDDQGAIDLLTLLDDDRSDLDGLATIARLERGLGRVAEARAIAEQASRFDADAGTLLLAEAEAAAGDRATARARLPALFANADRGLAARQLAAELDLALGHPEQALAAIADGHARDAKHGELVTLAAFALVDLGKLADARTQLAVLGDTPDAQFALARTLERAGDRAGALAVLLPVVKAHPESSSANNLAGYLLAESGRGPEARPLLERARAQAPGDPAILDSWGVYLTHAGQLDAAQKALQTAVRHAPLEPEIAVHLAQVWVKTGAPKRAIELLDRASTLQPSPSVQKTIAELRQTIARGK